MQRPLYFKVQGCQLFRSQQNAASRDRCRSVCLRCHHYRRWCDCRCCSLHMLQEGTIHQAGTVGWYHSRCNPSVSSSSSACLRTYYSVWICSSCPADTVCHSSSAHVSSAVIGIAVQSLRSQPLRTIQRSARFKSARIWQSDRSHII